MYRVLNGPSWLTTPQGPSDRARRKPEHWADKVSGTLFFPLWGLGGNSECCMGLEGHFLKKYRVDKWRWLSQGATEGADL